MSVLGSFLAGLGRVQRAPRLVCGLWLLTLVLALPLALVLDAMLAGHLGASLAAQAAADGMNYDWWNEFRADASGIGDTWVPAVIGFAAVLRNLSDIADAQAPPTVVLSAVAVHTVLSTFLLGGVLDRLARVRATGAHGFFAACGVFFFRFLRLAIVAGIVYLFLFTTVHAWIFDDWYAAWTREVTVERTAFVYRVGGYALFGAMLVAVNLVFDYAKIRAVVEDRRSMLGALAAGVRFIGRHWRAVLGLYLLNVALFLSVLLFYVLAAPEPAGSGTVIAALFTGQLYIVLRIIVRLQFAASQMVLFQSRLAHAAYTAMPTVVWPDSPAVESIRGAGC